jgi:hypothetical protein
MEQWTFNFKDKTPSLKNKIISFEKNKTNKNRIWNTTPISKRSVLGANFINLLNAKKIL